ncbi:MAG: lactate racemase domain-containing protein, partial [Desulfobacterales bacterium]
MEYPHMIRVRQRFDDTILENVAEEIDARLADLNLETAIKPGQSVAIACSSRGIDNYGVIVKAVITYLKQFKLEPFIIPAMGSHGAATAAGQKRVLAHLGVVEEDVGAPIRSSLEVMRIGKTEDHLTVYLDKLASAADHIVLINRIKKHTEFEHEFESGLLKMMAIGLGKQEGAAAYHEAMLSLGYPRVILTVARKIMQSTNVLFGVGVVENGYGQTAQIGIGRSDDILEMEKGLFKKARQFAPALPFDEADILIIDEMGKDISGTGFDTKVVGRIGFPLVAAEPTSPRIKRIMVCDLTEGSEGNAVGVGIVDIITQRLL